MRPSLFRGLPVKRGHEWSAWWFLRLLEQSHSCLLGQSIAFLAVTPDTGYHDVFPRSSTTTITRNYVIHIQFLDGTALSAVLALVFIAFQQVLPVELHFLHQHAVVRTENQNTRHQHLLINGIDDTRTRRILQVLAIREPSLAIEHSETSVLCKNHLRVIERKQAERSLDPDDIDCLPKTVEHEGLITGIHPAQDITDFPPSMSKDFSQLLHANRVT